LETARAAGRDPPLSIRDAGCWRIFRCAGILRPVAIGAAYSLLQEYALVVILQLLRILLRPWTLSPIQSFLLVASSPEFQPRMLTSHTQLTDISDKMRRCTVVAVHCWLTIVGTVIVVVQSLSSSSSSSRRGGQRSHNSDDERSNLLILGLGRVGWYVAQQASTANTATAVTLTESLVSEQKLQAPDSTRLTAKTRLFGRIFGTIRRERETPLTVHDSNATTPITVLLWNQTADILQAAQTCSHLLVTIPPVMVNNTNETMGDCETAPESLYTQILQSMVLQRHSNPCWIGILSTTGVYGNHNGQWVTEESPCLVDQDTTAFRYLEHEESWKRRVADLNDGAATANSRRDPPFMSEACCLRIFRCAGIYGPSQSALHTVFKNKQAYSAPRIRASSKSSNAAEDTTTALDTLADARSRSATGASWGPSETTNDITNRIHVTDLTAAIVASMREHSSRSTSTSPLEYYNLADDEPESRRVVMDHAVQLLQSIGVWDVMDQESSFKVGRAYGSVVHPAAAAAAAAAAAVAVAVAAAAAAAAAAAVAAAPSPSPSPSPMNTVSSRARRRTVDAKRVSNAKMRRDLLPTLQYPTYRQGLVAILLHQPNPWPDDLRK
jgi:hypothetical protein